jgi:hypothetical protein
VHDQRLEKLENVLGDYPVGSARTPRDDGRCVARVRSAAVDPVRRQHEQGAWRAREEAAGSDKVADEVLREVSEAAADVPMSAETAVVREIARQLAEVECGR